MTPDRTDANPDENAEHGVLDESGNLDTASITILGGHIAQVSVDLPLGSHDDDIDDDVVEDEVPVDEAEIRSFEAIGQPFTLDGGNGAPALTYVPEPQTDARSTVHDDVHVEHLPTGDIILEPHDGDGAAPEDESDDELEVHDAEIIGESDDEHADEPRDESEHRGGFEVVSNDDRGFADAEDDRVEPQLILSTDGFDPAPVPQLVLSTDVFEPDDVEGHADDVRADDVRADDVRADDERADDVRGGDERADDVRADDVGGGDDRVDEELTEAVAEDHGDAVAADLGEGSEDAESADSQPADSQPADSEGAGFASEDGDVADARVTGPAETEPTQDLAVEDLAVEGSAEDALDDDLAHAERELAEEVIAEQESAERELAEEQIAAQEPAEQEPAEQEPAEHEPAEHEPAEHESAEQDPAEATQSEDEVESPVDEHTDADDIGSDVPTVHDVAPDDREQDGADMSEADARETERVEVGSAEAERSEDELEAVPEAVPTVTGIVTATGAAPTATGSVPAPTGALPTVTGAVADAAGGNQTGPVATTTGSIPRTRAERAATGAIGTVRLTRREVHQADEAARVGRAHAAERVRTPGPDLTLTSKRSSAIDDARESPDLLTADRLLDPRQVARPEPEGLWQQLVYSMSGHRINLGDGRRARERKELDRRIATPLAGGARFVPVLSRKGGVGKTTVTSLLGMALADARDDRVIAVDANPDRGTLADRVGRPNGRTVRDLVRAHDEVDGYHDVSSIVARDATRLDVLASDSDPRVSEAFSDDDYRQVADVAAHYYSIVLTDTGTGIVHSVMEATLERADSLVVVAGLSVDEARLASETLTWLETNGYADRVRSAVVVINSARPGTPLVRESELETHFRTRVQTVIRMPYDPRIAAGSAISFRDLQPETRLAARQLAAAVVEGLRAPVAAA